MYAPFELEMPGDLAGALDALAAGRDAKTVPVARCWRRFARWAIRR